MMGVSSLFRGWRIFDAMASCLTYQVVSGSTVIDMSTQKTAAPDLGDEQWSQLLAYSLGGQRSVVEQTAIRIGNVLVIVSGSSGLVDTNLEKAVAKVQAASGLLGFPVPSASWQRAPAYVLNHRVWRGRLSRLGVGDAGRPLRLAALVE